VRSRAIASARRARELHVFSNANVLSDHGLAAILTSFVPSASFGEV
jgi:hypothetical protein